MKSLLSAKKRNSIQPRRTASIGLVTKKANLSSGAGVQSRKKQLEMELFEHHLLGFGPCG
ncbi:MAG: hypothetical protein HQL69_03220 [Magnetococcales bacterium]|nr:hypothetical protein [Magnetococcales bacterium]